MSMDKEKNILENIRSKQPGYPDAEFFEQMAERVIAEHSSPFARTPFYKKPVVRWIAAAAITIPFVFFLARNNQPGSGVSPVAGLDVPQEVILEYVEEQEEEGVLMAFKAENTADNSSVRKTVRQLTEEVRTEEISEYLIEEYGDWEGSEEAYLYY